MTKTYTRPRRRPAAADGSVDRHRHLYRCLCGNPASTMRDIVTSYLPGWTGMRMWIIARPLSGFAETFSQYIVELAPAAATPGRG